MIIIFIFWKWKSIPNPKISEFEYTENMGKSIIFLWFITQMDHRNNGLGFETIKGGVVAHAWNTITLKALVGGTTVSSRHLTT